MLVARALAHTPQAKCRVRRGFSTAHDLLSKGLRVAGSARLNERAAIGILPRRNRTLVVACPCGECALQARSEPASSSPPLWARHHQRAVSPGKNSDSGTLVQS